MSGMEFRASELVIRQFSESGEDYLAFRNPGNPALVKEAREKGVADYEVYDKENESED